MAVSLQDSVGDLGRAGVCGVLLWGNGSRPRGWRSRPLHGGAYGSSLFAMQTA